MDSLINAHINNLGILAKKKTMPEELLSEFLKELQQELAEKFFNKWPEDKKKHRGIADERIFGDIF